MAHPMGERRCGDACRVGLPRGFPAPAGRPWGVQTCYAGGAPLEAGVGSPPGGDTPGLAEFFSELRELEDLNPQDRAAALRANDAYLKRARAAREEVKDVFSYTADGDSMTCG